MSVLLRSAAIREIEADWLARTGDGELMARAARAVADAAQVRLRGLPVGTEVLAFCGPGNNGGDALLAALILMQRGYPVRAFEFADLAAATRPADAARVSALATACGLEPVLLRDEASIAQLFVESPEPANALVIDGVFGIGLTRPLNGLPAHWARLLARASAEVVSIDVPSGIDADTGAIVMGPMPRGGEADPTARDGESSVSDVPTAVRADVTVTMIADKPGLHTGAAVAHRGRVIVAPLGTNLRPGSTTPGPGGQLFGRTEAAELLPPRPLDSNKGSFGSVLIAGGGHGMAGAALLAARAASCSGTGKVWVVSPHEPIFDPGQPQLMSRDPAQSLADADAIVAGCGLGTSAVARELLARVLETDRPLVLDADALNLIAQADGCASLAQRTQAAVLTPHPLEAARLARTDAAGIQRDRIAAACVLAQRFRSVVILKGAGSVVADASGDWAVIDAGGPALATAGTGDVLAGLVGGLLAQGVPSYDAARLGCWLHADAGDRWTLVHKRPGGMSAAELPRWLGVAMAGLQAPCPSVPPHR